MHKSLSPPPGPLSSTGSTFGTRVPRSVVTSLALHGHARPGEDGVRIKMYLKIALSAEHTTMGLVPLFPEANSIRILQYAVHPLDSAGAPYAGGPKTNRLLKRASRALQLPPESTKSYLDALVMSPGAGYSSRRAQSVYQTVASPSSASPPPPLDTIHTGSIEVSNYAVCFVLPKLWPRVGAESESDDFMSRSTPFTANRRRSSIGSDKKSFRFMAGIEIVVPYLSVPPESPYLLSIPLPKCLSNKLQLKIFGPPQLDPLVDHEDLPRWDVTTDPVVQHRNSSLQLPASSRYGHVADDEDFSDASETNVQTETGLVVIQGAFPSTDRLRIRWAPALNADTLPLDGWQRASCSRVDGKLRLTVLEALRDPENAAQCNALRLSIDYAAECRGVVHPGVATRLAMDVMLDSKGQAVTWAYPSEVSPGGRAAATWNVISDKGLLGFDAGGQSPSTPQALSRRTSSSSFDASVPGSPASLDGSVRSRKSSIPVPAGPASLLNVPLPLEAGSDYSFEAQPQRTSSMSSSVLSAATGISQMTSDQDAIALSMTNPAHRLSLHIDMDEILPRSPQEGSSFSYTINGVVDVKMTMQPHAFSSESSQTDDDPMGRVEGLVDLPVFHMLNVPEANEHIQITVVSNVPGTMLSSGNTSSSLVLRSGATKRQLRLGIPIACSEGAQLSLKQLVAPTTPVPAHKGSTFSLGSPRAPNGALPTDSMQLRMPKLPINGTPLRREDSDPLSAIDTGRSSASPSVTGAADIITRVDVHIELLPAPATQMRAHRVRVRVPAASIDTDRLEFALRTRAGEDNDTGPPLVVEVVYASVGGRPVETKVLHGAKPEPGAVALSEGADATWVTVYLGSTTGAVADVEVLYTVTQAEGPEAPTNDLLAVVPPEGASCVVSLPSFYPSVGLMRVEVQEPSGYCIKSFVSNMQSNRQARCLVMTHHALPCKFTPQLSICLVEESSTRSRNWTGFLLVLSWLITIFALYTAYIQQAHIQDLQHVLVLGSGAVRPAHLRYVESGASVPPGTATTPRHIHMPTSNIPPMREREHPALGPEQPPAETGLSVVQRVRHSLSLRPDDLRNLLAALPTTTAAAQAFSNFVAHAMKLLRRVMHFPLPVED